MEDYYFLKICSVEKLEEILGAISQAYLSVASLQSNDKLMRKYNEGVNDTLSWVKKCSDDVVDGNRNMKDILTVEGVFKSPVTPSLVEPHEPDLDDVTDESKRDELLTQFSAAKAIYDEKVEFYEKAQATHQSEMEANIKAHQMFTLEGGNFFEHVLEHSNRWMPGYEMHDRSKKEEACIKVLFECLKMARDHMARECPECHVEGLNDVLTIYDARDHYIEVYVELDKYFSIRKNLEAAELARNILRECADLMLGKGSGKKDIVSVLKKYNLDGNNKVCLALAKKNPRDQSQPDVANDLLAAILAKDDRESLVVLQALPHGHGVYQDAFDRMDQIVSDQYETIMISQLNVKSFIELALERLKEYLMLNDLDSSVRDLCANLKDICDKLIWLDASACGDWFEQNYSEYLKVRSALEDGSHDAFKRLSDYLQRRPPEDSSEPSLEELYQEYLANQPLVPSDARQLYIDETLDILVSCRQLRLSQSCSFPQETDGQKRSEVQAKIHLRELENEKKQLLSRLGDYSDGERKSARKRISRINAMLDLAAPFKSPAKKSGMKPALSKLNVVGADGSSSPLGRNRANTVKDLISVSEDGAHLRLSEPCDDVHGRRAAYSRSRDGSKTLTDLFATEGDSKKKGRGVGLTIAVPDDDSSLVAPKVSSAKVAVTFSFGGGGVDSDSSDTEESQVARSLSATPPGTP